MWGVNNKGLVRCIPCCCGFESSDVGAVSKLGLCVATDDLVVLGWLGEQLLLLWGGLVSKGGLHRISKPSFYELQVAMLTKNIDA